MANMTFSFVVPLAGGPETELTTLVGTAGGAPTNINVDDGQHDNQFSVGDAVTTTAGQTGTYVGSFGNGIVVQGDLGLPTSFVLLTNDSTLGRLDPVVPETTTLRRLLSRRHFDSNRSRRSLDRTPQDRGHGAHC